MTYISPLTEEDKRRRRRMSGVVEDGEYVSFDLAFRDSAPSTSAYMTDSAQTPSAADADSQAAATAANRLNDWRGTPSPTRYVPADKRDNPDYLAGREDAARERAAADMNSWRNAG